MIKKYLILCFLSISFCACFKEDKPLILPEKNMHSQYLTLDCKGENEELLYLNLNTKQQFVFLNTNWDIALQSDNQGNAIRINHSDKANQLYESSDTSLFTPFKTILKNGTKMMDSVNTWTQNTAIGDWWRNGLPKRNIYLYHQEPDIYGKGERAIKFRINKIKDKKYTIDYIDEIKDKNSIINALIPQNNDYNFVYYSFKEEGIIKNMEPIKTDWDILFTSYRDMVKYEVDQTFYPYQVLGVLINPYNTWIHKTASGKGFYEIDQYYCKNAPMCEISNTVGYDWKTFNLNLSKYSTDTSASWILKNSKGEYFKFRFLNFYNQKGVSGYPTIEFVQF